jgi:hypothetical protein
VLIAFGEMPFREPLDGRFDVRVLLEVDARETTRRICELGEEHFDDAFTEQFVQHDGRVYEAYLKENRVRERSSVIVDASTPGQFRSTSASGPSQGAREREAGAENQRNKT